MKIADLLHSVNVPTIKPPDSFKKWLAERFPAWKSAGEFCQALPADWTLVMNNGYDLCYVAEPGTIHKTCGRLDASPAFKAANLLPIGALMDGGLLLIDTQDLDEMSVGRLMFEHFAAVPEDKISPERFYKFNMNYPEWLDHIISNPCDARYL